MRTKVTIENLKSTNCKQFVHKGMQRVQGISNVKINVRAREVSFSYTTHNVLEGLRAEMASWGYPITGDPNNI